MTLRTGLGPFPSPPTASVSASACNCASRARAARTPAASPGAVEQLLTREGIGLRERTLWRMLYETASRSAEVLALNVEDLDLPSRRAKAVRRHVRLADPGVPFLSMLEYFPEEPMAPASAWA